MMYRKRIEIGRQPNPNNFTEGGGNYWYPPCHTCEEQFGCVYPVQDAAQVPPFRWISIEILGLKNRLRHGDNTL